MKRYYNNYNREIVTFSLAVNQTDEIFTTMSVFVVSYNTAEKSRVIHSGSKLHSRVE